ncbi:MAG: serine/threonine protein kinase [Acidobacteriaceae bacterium]|nr:serine/threonine protein kinase [Acidobacteriaceae bacterium]
MTPARAVKIEELFELTIDQPATERRSLLEAACGGDQTLIEDVLLLLEADAAGSHRALRQNMTNLAGQLLCQNGIPTVSSQFGRYTIIDFLGQGGMGWVYLAERQDLGDKVAIKFLQDAWSSPERRDRFAREQRMLASLTHPHIARLYDAGVENGTPWFAMEYVKGEPITVYCEAHRLGLAERLRLFRAACEAIRYAHRGLTVHLDLKPSNILVNEGGEVRLLDFGIARSLDTDGRETQKTKTGFRLFSLNYASPEQIRGEMLDVQTDIHGLGVILYELLTGRTPSDLSNASASELSRYTEEEVLPASQAARENEQTAIQISQADWRDLDVLCGTALHRDRTRRYGTADALIRDLDHFLAHEPLEAQTDSFRYRLSKFGKRNRRQLIAAAAVVALIVVLTSVFTVRLVAARSRVQASEARTQRVHQLMLNLFEGDDDVAGPARGLRVVDLLDRGVKQAEGLTGDPALHAQLQYTFGSLYQKLGRPGRAEPLLRSALNEQTRAFGPDNPETIKSQLALARLGKEQSKLDEAERMVRDVIERAKRNFTSDSREVAAANAALGSVLEARGDIKGALPLLEGAERILSSGPVSVELSEVLSDLADTHYLRGDISISEKMRRRALALDRELFGAHHPKVAADLNNLGDMQMDRGQYSAAEGLYRQALEIDRAWYGDAHQKTGENFLGLATALLEQKRYEEAGAAFDRALAAIRASDGEQSFRFAAVLSLMGDMARVRKQFDHAGELYEQAAEIMRHAVGERNQFYAMQLSGTGAIYVLKREYRKGEIVLRKALGILQAIGPAERYTGLTLIRLAAALAGQKRYSNAEKEALAAYSTLREKTAPQSIEQITARKQLYEIYMAMQQPAKANQFR